MPKYDYTLRIDNPCSEAWDSMRTDGKRGKFCQRCAKNVTDFTRLTDAEILQLITRSEGKLCGRLNEDQLNRVLAGRETASLVHPTLYGMLAGLLLVPATGNSTAHEKPHSVSITARNDVELTPVVSHGEKAPHESDSLKNSVSGKVIDAENNEPIPFAIVSLKHSSLGATTDVNGNFEVIVPDSLLHDKIDFVITSLGYEQKEFTVYKQGLPVKKDFLILPVQRVFMGEIAVTIKKKKWWQRKK